MLTVEVMGQKEFGPCSCCGHVSSCVWGSVLSQRETVAVYYVHWTIGKVNDHWPNFDLIVGPWGEGTTAQDRTVISLQYRLLDTGPAFMVIDATGRPAANGQIAAHAMLRSEVVGTDLARQAFEFADTVLANDERISELLGGWTLSSSQ